ncbi:MAG: lipoprotein [Gammaproteobacteria bacterium]|nr:lipoprotein [Gammaproteobacteria bacterium]
MKYCLLILFVISILPGCGQKGDLFLEEPKPENTAPNKKADQNKDEDSEDISQ